LTGTIAWWGSYPIPRKSRGSGLRDETARETPRCRDA